MVQGRSGSEKWDGDYCDGWEKQRWGNGGAGKSRSTVMRQGGAVLLVCNKRIVRMVILPKQQQFAYCSQKMQANLIFNLAVFTVSLAGWAVVRLLQRRNRRIRAQNILNFSERSHISTISSLGFREDIHAYFQESQAHRQREGTRSLQQ